MFMFGRAVRNTIVAWLVLSLAGAVLAGEPVEIRLKDGTRWKGQISDYVQLTHQRDTVAIELKGRLVKAAEFYVTVETDVAGEIRTQTIFKGDIVRISTLTVDPLAVLRRAEAENPARKKGAEPVKSDKPGVFVLPLSGMVGLEFRHDEMEKVAEEADKYGDGQIIVLLIDSGGGGLDEMVKIHTTLAKIKQRHRLVAWIKEAISAACAAALNCDEIYFMTEGTAGAMTGFNAATGVALSGEELDEWLRTAGDWAETGGRSRYIAEAMIHAPKLLSYTKNPETGQVTFYNNLSGQKILSDAKENLVFTASTALECGFSDGTADTEADLAKKLDLPEWHEISDLGRKLEKEWTATVEEAKHELPLLRNRLDYAGTGSGDPVEILGKRIQIYEQVIKWIDRCPNCARGLSKEALEREVKELRKQLGDLKKRQ